MKRSISRAVRAVCFLLILCLLLSQASAVLADKHGANIIVPYYEEPRGSLDVLFFGSSHIMCSVYPMALWEQYGIAAYDCCTSAQVLPQTYFQIKDALRFQSPSLVVLDVSGVFYDNQMVGSESFVHTQLDNMKSLPVWLEAILTLIPPKDWAEYLLPLVRFHSRWQELEPQDWDGVESSTNGASVYANPIAETAFYEIVPAEQTGKIADVPEKYLRKCIEYLQKKGIDVLLLNTPSNVEPDAQRRYNAVAKIAQEYGVNYLNLLQCYAQMNFDPAADLHDNDHCDAAGAMKATRYIGQYILQHYDVPVHTGETAYAQWDADAAEFLSRLDVDGA